MEACLSLERELDKLLIRFGGVKEQGLTLLDSVIADIKTLQAEVNNGELFKIAVHLYPLFFKSGIFQNDKNYSRSRRPNTI